MPEEKKISTSIFQKRWKKFKTIKRGYYSFLIIVTCFIISFLLPLFVNRDALIVKYEDSYYFPVFKFYPAETFKQGWHEAMSGETLPLSELWQDIDAE